MDGGLVLGSKDAEAFYPNIEVNTAAEEAKLEIMESEVELEGVNTEEVAWFLACSMSQEEIDREGLTHVVHRRRFRMGARPGLTCKAITGGPEVRAEDQSWLPPSRKRGRRQIREMVGCLVSVACRLVMKNHFYSYNNQIRKQGKGGAIRNSLTQRFGQL